jgi:hypothetical protein
MPPVSARCLLHVKHLHVVILDLKYLDIKSSDRYDMGRTGVGKGGNAMMWSDKAFSIYMGDAGTAAAFAGPGAEADAFDVMVNRADIRPEDPCSDGDARSSDWRSQPGTALGERTQLRRAAGG